MIIHRIELKDYRGVKHREVSLGGGVTVIEGPNEYGKTSLAEALRLLFDYKDSSKHSQVKSTFPVDRDEGPCVEAEIETGPYRFIYRKRFKKKPETELRVLAPAPENHTGEEAHERANALLSETLDVDLWKALKVDQGVALEQAALSDSTALSAALDAASGSTGSGAEYGPVYERARAEYERYFTGTGKENKELTEPGKNVEGLEQQLNTTRARLDELGEDTERLTQLTESIRGLESGLPEVESEAAEARENWTALSKLVEQAKTAKAEASAAELKSRRAGEAVAARRKLTESLSSAEIQLKELESSSKDEIEAWEKAAQQHQEDEAELGKRKEAHSAAVDALAQCRSDREYRDAESEIERFEERLKYIEEAEAKMCEALEQIKSTSVTEDACQELQRLERAFEIAAGQLAAGGPQVRLHAHANLDAKVNGTPMPLKKGENREMSVDHATTISVPGVLEAIIEPGTSIRDLSQAVDTAREEMAKARRRYGVDSAQNAFKTLREVEAAENAVEQSKEQIRQHERDLTREEIAARSAALVERFESYEADRVSDLPLPANIEKAEEAFGKAEAACEGARIKLDVAIANEKRARERLETLRAATDETRVQLRTKKGEIARLNEELKHAERTVPLIDLEAKSQDLDEQARVARESADKADADLAERDPGKVEALCESAEARLKNGREALQKRVIERSTVEGRLDANRERGLAEEADQVEAKLSAARVARDRIRASAEAARLLFETLDRHREEARRAYVAPLKSRVDRLGKVVFGEDFEVTVSDDLTIESRTLGGTTVPYDDLSGGTKEQVGLLVRIAAAMTVAEDSGVPLILDDTLGYSDPERIRTMCAMLSQAGRECQIVILTCTPERFRGIGGAVFLGIADEPVSA